MFQTRDWFCGHLRAIGRGKDVIIRGGDNIPVVEVESLLCRHPANAFVMSFLGTVSSLNGILVRPHDIRVGRNPEMAIAADDGTAETTGVTRATIERIAYLGFEVRG